MAELEQQLKDALKENKELQIKVEKFSVIAGEAATLATKCNTLKQNLKEAMVELDVLTDKYKKEQKIRKALNNELEDMKGKVRVYARVRPLSKTELADEVHRNVCTNIIDEFSVHVGKEKNRIKEYNFDTVFGPDSTQEEVFEDTRRLVQSAIDGFNVCIFAYGQTGSGKTFTIQGSEDLPGLTPRSIVELFDICKEMSNYDIKLKCFMVELYLNDLRDLLLPPKTTEIPKLEIKENATGMVVIQGV